VLPETASSDETFAADELQDHIKKMSGASIPIVQGSAPQGMANRRQEGLTRCSSQCPSAIPFNKSMVSPDTGPNQRGIMVCRLCS
jgi:hypothetical protein